jgi:hypothetical protein
LEAIISLFLAFCYTPSLLTLTIVLFHNGAKNTPAALPTVLQTLQGQGYKIVPVSQLIYKSDYTIDNAGMQIPKSNSSNLFIK